MDNLQPKIQFLGGFRMSKRNGSTPRFPLRAGCFICNVNNADEARERECQLYKELSFDDYSHNSDCAKIVKVVKHRVQDYLQLHMSTPKQWRVLRRNQEQFQRYFQQVGLYMELLLLICARGPGIRYFDEVAEEVFSYTVEKRYNVYDIILAAA